MIGRTIVAIAFMAFVFATTGAAQSQQQSPPRPPACASPEHRQFDFWVGNWSVYRTGNDKLVAHSLIESLYGGCGIRENWMPLKGAPGGSLNSYIPEDRLWRQIWIDAGNGWGTFEGKFENGAMVLSGTWKNVNGPNTSAFTRTTWTRNKDGSVRQFGEMRGADGRWSPAFDFTYRAANPKP